MKTGGIKFIFLVYTALFAAPVVADCRTTGSTFENLGSFTSLTISNQSIDSTFSSSFACDGFVNLLDYSRIDATLLAADFNLENLSGDLIPYILYTDAGYSDPFLLGETVEFGSFNLIDLLGLFSNVDGSLPLFIRTLPTNIPVGNYQDTISIRWDWDYCSGISVLFICLGRNRGSEVISITLEVTVTETCDVSSQDVNFGSVADLTTPYRSSLIAEVNCTKNLSYSFYIDGGDNYANGVRNMAQGTNQISYLLLAEDGITPVGPTINESLMFVGTGTSQSIAVTAETEIQTTLPPVGFYGDTVRVIVSF